MSIGSFESLTGGGGLSNSVDMGSDVLRGGGLSRAGNVINAPANNTGLMIGGAVALVALLFVLKGRR